MNILILNGPNLNLLGKREPGIYGTGSYDDLCMELVAYAAARDIRVDIRQSNHEGALIDEIQAADGVYDGIVINPGAYTHYSYAIYDALLAVSVPAIEVHLSNINRRESFRRISVTAPACRAQIVGHGFLGYMEAMDPAGRRWSSGMRLCVIGDPVGHSLSPLLHRRMLDRAGLTGSYETVTVTPDTLPEFLAAARAGAWDGCNVTMPLKQAILPLLDELDPAAAACGAVNTVCFRRGLAVGYNTDAPGIRAGLLAHGADPRAGQVLIIGNGGAARRPASPWGTAAC